ncbi:MAG: DPP IV N-terminal domain-containing protein [Bacteroides sp.]|nr:DPP IV N-terminal domain-containing protein [Bacteroides sp.]
MKKLYLLFALALLAAGCSPGITITEAHYERAESYLLPNISKRVYHLEVRPHWLADSSGFWHFTQTREGKRFFITSLEEPKTRPLFNHSRLAASLGEILEKEVDPSDLPFDQVRFVSNDLISFSIGGGTYHYDLTSQTLTIPEEREETDREPGLSPDGRYEAFIRDYNLFVREVETGEEQQLSTAGRRSLEYASILGWYDLMEGEGGERPENFFVSWSPDSRKLYTYLVDLSKAEKMYLLDFSVDNLFRPRLLSYYRGSPGDTTLVWYRPVLFDLASGHETFFDIPPVPHFNGLTLEWTEDSESLFGIFAHRGYKQADLIRVDAGTGQVETLISETSDTSVEYSSLILERVGKDKILFSSQQTGWHHLNLHEWNTGKLINPVTSGEYVVKRVLHVDEDHKVIYFVAAGREPGRDPYYNHLYRVNFDGKGLSLLTPEDAHHEFSLSPGGQFVVDNYSRVDLPTVSVLRKLSDGREVYRISEADASDLLSDGWTPPMRFTVKGRDDITDIYGIVYRPFNFNPRRKYPLIDYSYTGPHTASVPKSFSAALLNIQNPLRAFGFAVMVVDGLGTNGRSRAFRDISYQKMGFSLDCHVAAISQLGERHPWIDTTRVGIYGHSAGGYDAARAMLQYPNVYKVGVASAADHDHRMEKAWWPEMYMGYPVGDFYHEQSNVTNAANLRGRLLIAHGALDHNVNPSATYKLAEYLIRAQKDFDMLIIPSANHSFGRSQGDYFTKVRWNYFIRHLLPAEPVHNYRFRTILKEE